MQLSFPAAFCPPQTAPQGVSAPPKPALGERGARLRRAALRGWAASFTGPGPCPQPLLPAVFAFLPAPCYNKKP